MSLKLFKRKCERIEPFLWRYASGRLDADASGEVETHLHTCAACRTQLLAYRQTWQGVETLRALPVPASEAGWSEARERLAAAGPQTAMTQMSGFAGVSRAIAWGGGVTAAAILFAWMLTSRVQDAGEAELATESATPVKVRGMYALGRMEKSPAALPLPSPSVGLSVLKTPIAPTKYTSLPPAGQTASGRLVSVRNRAERLQRLQIAGYALHNRHRRQTRLAKNPLREHSQVKIVSAWTLDTHNPVEAGLQMPEYVMTTVPLDDPQRPARDFVMDSVSPEDLQAASETGDGNDQETRVW